MILPQGWHSLTVRLVAADPERLVRFLREAFGAEGAYETEMPSMLAIGDSRLMISGAGPRDVTSSLTLLYVDDADAVYARALRVGATSVEEPCDTPWGDRRAIVKDPAGNDWQIATYREDWSA